MGLVLVRMSSVDTFCAAGVCRGWRAAARSLTSLRFSSSITLHCETRHCHPSAAGGSRLLCCLDSPLAAQIQVLDLTLEWAAEPQAVAIELPCACSSAAALASTPRLQLTGLQQLCVSFRSSAETLYGLQSRAMTDLSTSLLGVLVRDSPQLQRLIVSLDPQLPAVTAGFQPLHVTPASLHGSDVPAHSPLERILLSKRPALKTVEIRDNGPVYVSLHLDFDCLPRSGQLDCLVIQAPKTLMGTQSMLDAEQGANPGAALTELQQHVHCIPKRLELRTEELTLFDAALEELRLLQAACKMVIRGYGSVERPEVHVFNSEFVATDASELHAMLESMIQSPPIACAPC